MIERIEVTRHRLPLDPPFHAAWDRRPRAGFPVTVVRVFDADGRMGFGAGDAMAGLEHYLHLFVGEPADDLERHGQILANIAFHEGRPWPLDTALWDLVGKQRGEPIWRMLGGEGGSIPLYASWGSVVGASDSVARAGATVAAGFRAIKLRLGRAGGIDEDVDVLEAVREAVGPTVELMVDANQGWRMPWDVEEAWDLDTALAFVERVAPSEPAWVEEPLGRGDHDGMAALRAASPIPIAGAEMIREAHELDLLLERGCLDVYQPDVVVTAGFARLARFARTVSSGGAIFSPHTWGSGVALLANAHLVGGTNIPPFLEFPFDPPGWSVERRDFLLTEPLVAVDGHLALPNGPGLGAELDEEALAATRTDSVAY